MRRMHWLLNPFQFNYIMLEKEIIILVLAARARCVINSLATRKLQFSACIPEERPFTMEITAMMECEVEVNVNGYTSYTQVSF